MRRKLLPENLAFVRVLGGFTQLLFEICVPSCTTFPIASGERAAVGARKNTRYCCYFVCPGTVTRPEERCTACAVLVLLALLAGGKAGWVESGVIGIFCLRLVAAAFLSSGLPAGIGAG